MRHFAYLDCHGGKSTTLLTSSNQIVDHSRRTRRHRHRPEPESLEETLPDDFELLLTSGRDSISGCWPSAAVVAAVLRHRASDTWAIKNERLVSMLLTIGCYEPKIMICRISFNFISHKSKTKLSRKTFSLTKNIF